ncbi:TolC family protein [Trinickia caryophylli]|uniref:Outer membrane protein TolC n=1 Tax=Trinickia caryophylli TaxID=28094 RepID=A0A1X7H3Y6_TRICW|nr:TolC family protein [Trinickia caryophylli]PMS08829.1 hypothetical protein C0Z17_28120 [Trinickia caryophylli]TRX17320.1 hypothetical protein FNF07_03110 [Trinickia caryophylli]WQE11940.1 TolC family protein [Trinickia caryophylli]SMF79363.1 Outer membrane protein TolC [Trinickia caryophylli]GLU35670.1 histidine kinase [Trinickia caryophylli]
MMETLFLCKRRAVWLIACMSFATACTTICPSAPDAPPVGNVIAEPSDASFKGERFELSPDMAWWKNYHDDQLDALMAKLEPSIERVTQEASASSSIARSNYARLFRYLPKLTISAGASLKAERKQGSNADSGAKVERTPEIALPRLEFDASPILGIFGSGWSAVSSSAISRRTAIATRFQQRLDIQASIVRIYFALRATARTRELLDAKRTVVQQALALEERRAALGASEPGALARRREEVSSVRQAVLDNTRDRRKEEHELLMVLGGYPSGITTVSTLPLAPPPVPQINGTSLSRQSPPVALSALHAALEAENVKSKYMDLIPLPSFFATGLLSDVSLFPLAWVGPIWTVGARFAVNLLNLPNWYIDRQARIDAYRKAELDRRKEVIGIRDGIIENFYALRDLREKYERSSAETSRRDDIVAATKTQCRLGLKSPLQMLDVQARLLDSRIDCIQNIGSQYRYSIELVKALGGGWTASSNGGGQPPKTALRRWDSPRIQAVS